MPNVTLPLSYLVEIITNSPPPHLPSAFNSRLPNIPDFTPSIIRYEIGVLLKALDESEDFVKVFLYPASHHAEVWLAGEWRQSNTHHWQLKHDSLEYREARAKEEQARLSAHNRRQLMLAYLEAQFAMDPKTVASQKLAEALTKISPDNEIIDQFVGLRKFLKDHEPKTPDGNDSSVPNTES